MPCICVEDLQVKMFKNKKSALDTTKRGGRAAPDVTLDYVKKDLIENFKALKGLQDAENEIKKKYKIDENTTVWNEDDVKKAWGKTQRMQKNSGRRKAWSLAIFLQAIHERPQIKSEKRSCFHSDYTKDDDSTLDRSPTRSHVGTELGPNAGTESQLIMTNDKKKMVKKRTTKTSRKSGNDADSQKCFIRIPLTFMDVSDATSCQQTENNGYKLIDGVPSLTQTMKKSSYVIQYDQRTRNAAWVFEQLKKRKEKEDFEDKPIRSNNYFQDSMIHKHYTSENVSYKKGYQKGHLAAAANHNWSRKAMDDTFLLSNIAPQNSDLNRSAWKELEEKCRRYTNEYKNVFVYTGPLYIPTSNKHEIKYQIIGDKAVPTHFFKVVILENQDGTLDVECYKVANAYGQSLQKTDLDDIEKLSGLVFSEKSQFVSNEERVTVKWSAREETSEKHSLETTFTITTRQDSKEQVF